MDPQEIIRLYEWRPGVCFRHPEKGTVDTAAVKTLHPRGEEARVVRACVGCVIAIEDAMREAADRSGGVYEPGHAGGDRR